MITLIQWIQSIQFDEFHAMTEPHDPRFDDQVIHFHVPEQNYDSGHDVEQQCLVPLVCSTWMQVYDLGDIWVLVMLCYLI